MVHAIYVVKLLVLYIFGGLFVATATSGLGPFWDVTAWWPELIVYERLILWTVLLETLGLAGSWGPLAGHFKPMTGGVRYWARPDTIRRGAPPRVAGGRGPNLTTERGSNHYLAERAIILGLTTIRPAAGLTGGRGLGVIGVDAGAQVGQESRAGPELAGCMRGCIEHQE
jgi:Transmembrane protein of unknown function (DUF3556)